MSTIWGLLLYLFYISGNFQAIWSILKKKQSPFLGWYSLKNRMEMQKILKNLPWKPADYLQDPPCHEQWLSSSQ